MKTTRIQNLLAAGLGAGGGASDLTTLKPHLGKRGFLTFAFDGRYKFARYYVPNGFNVPKTLDELFAHNDVQLFDPEKYILKGEHV